MKSQIDYFPIDSIWPRGLPRTPAEKRTASKFKCTLGTAISNLQEEIIFWGSSFVTVGTALAIGASGRPIFVNRPLEDPAVAIQFERDGQPVTFHCDRFIDPRSNLRAIGKTLENLRAIDRYGANQVLERMFSGLRALPAPGSANDHWSILGLRPGATADQVRQAFNHRIRTEVKHPDQGGDPEEFTALVAARDAALQEIDDVRRYG